MNEIKETVEKLLEAEKQAGEIISSANRQADKLNAETEKIIANLRAEILEAAKTEAKNLIEQTQNNVNQEKINRLLETEKQTDKLISSKQEQVPGLIKKIIDIIL